MQIWLGRLLLLIGGFAIAIAVVAATWGADTARQIPLDTDSETRLEGTASGLLTGSDDPVPVRYLNRTTADPDASDEDGVAFVQQTCVVVDEGDVPDCPEPDGDEIDERVIDISTTTVAVDRRDGTPVEDQLDYLEPDVDLPDFEGHVIKLPFDVEKTTYDYWDSTLGEAVSLEYVDEVEIAGRTTYEFRAEVPEMEGVVLAEGEDGAEDTVGSYSNTTTLWVDPATGAYVDQQVEQTMATEDGTVLLDIAVEYTDDQVAANADDAAANSDRLRLISFWIPVIGGIAGVVLIALGVWLIVRGRRARTATVVPAAADDANGPAAPVS